MNIRLAAIAMLAVAGIAFNALGLIPDRSVRSAGDEIRLLPEQVGEYRSTTQRWLNEPRPGMIEEGAMFSAGTAIPVQLDFFRRDPRAHNGLGCYLSQGETLLWERLQRLPTLRGSAEFDLGLAQTREGLRLVAATECRSAGCSEVPLPLLKQLGDLKKLIPQLFEESTDAVVPVSVVLTVPAENRDPALEAELMRQLQAFIAGLDLEPARKLAALQGGESVNSGNVTATSMPAARNASAATD